MFNREQQVNDIKADLKELHLQHEIEYSKLGFYFIIIRKQHIEIINFLNYF